FPPRLPRSPLFPSTTLFRSLVAREVLSAARPLSRAEVAARTGLNRATVSRLVAELVAGRLVTEDTPVVSGAGRPATPLRPAPCTVGGLGLEVSLDFLGARVLDLAEQVVAEEVVTGDHRASEAATVLAGLGGLAETVAARAAAEGTQVAGTALALPGLVAHARLLVAPNLGWREVDPAAHLPGLPGARLRLDNEARLAALAELAVSESRSFLYVSGGVGIGAAVVQDGVFATGVHNFA